MGNTGGRKLSPKTMAELQETVDFDKDEIKEWFDEYRSSLKAGQRGLTLDQFKAVYSTLFVGDASEFAGHVFRSFDTDNSGTVDFKEFLTGLYVSGTTDVETKLKWAFSMYDINKDGYISFEEMRHIVSAIYKMTAAKVPPEFATPELMTSRFFKDCDLNNDGLISWEEFKTGAQNQPVIVNLLACNPCPE